MQSTIWPLLLATATVALSLAGAARAEQTKLQRGKTLYTAYCERCHGGDGRDTSYPGVKSLAGITDHKSPQEIIDASRAFVTVRLEGEDAEALAAYIGEIAGERYARPEMLVTPEWVEKNGGGPHVKVFDMRATAAYDAGHIPGAILLPDGPLRNTKDTESYLPSPDAARELFGNAGINAETHVVAYDDQGGVRAARLWYVLSAYGHKKISIVNGGWQRWTAENRPVTNERPVVQPVRFEPRAVPDISCPSSELLARKPGTLVLDVRTAAEFAGSADNPRSGHVPGSVHIDWQDNVAGPHRAWKSAADLRKMYESKGVTKDKQIVTYCASGGRASHTLFTLKLLGYDKVRNYYGSFGDYVARPNAPLQRP